MIGSLETASGVRSEAGSVVCIQVRWIAENEVAFPGQLDRLSKTAVEHQALGQLRGGRLDLMPREGRELGRFTVWDVQHAAAVDSVKAVKAEPI